MAEINNKKEKSVKKEDIKHGSNAFPIASYRYNGNNFTKLLYAHWHTEVEVLCFEKGRFILNIETSPLVVDSPAMLLIPSKMIHSIALPGDAVESAIVFNAEIMRFAYYDKLQSNLYDYLYSTIRKTPFIVKPEFDGYQKLLEDFEYIRDNCKSKELMTQYTVKIKILDLFMEFERSGIFKNLELNTPFEKLRQEKLKELLEWIHDHHSGPLSVSDASKRMNFSEAYFCRFFKKAMNMSFIEYVNDYRLQMAADDILRGEKQISDVASDHGFDNESYFFRLFKKKYGITPLKYRQN
ncbi:helix-turn-helix transcriptional regulator [Succinivibrio dextrinosolvens]|uniref:AraC-type DNA-binding protein n=1 Tax=Succinivibrio dextrinosolvens TaxID=83771 RepID=A0A662ZBX8_9GAMM|nr:AraC family transcriptional regulator [Succinivibrio dextrinosolvens]SFK24137.1 AraC-type DNA-binding protein [Succinivibrio dextrinosolvens]